MFEDHSGAPPRRNFGTSKPRLLAIVALSLGLFLSACTGSPSDSGAGGGTPHKGGVVRIAISEGSSSDSLDPGVATSANSYYVVYAIYDTLATLTDDYEVKPSLAQSWDVSSDATKWTIHLRKGVKFSDGSDFTSKDVVYTMSRWLDPSTGSAAYGFVSPYMDMSGVSAPDASTVVLKLKKPQSMLMHVFANLPNSAIVKDGTTDFSLENAVGTGPFKLTDWKPGRSWKAVRNDDYWGGAPYLDEIDATITPDANSKIQSVIAGSADITDPVPASLWPTVQGQANATLVELKNNGAIPIEFDQTQKPFNDPRVLEALKLGTNRDEMVQTALQGHGQVVADVPINPDTSWYPAGLSAEYNPDKAKELLAEAGYPDGLDITLSTSASVPGMLDEAQAWQQAVKDAGINVTLDQLPADTYWSKGWMASSAYMDHWSAFFPPVGFDAFYTSGASYPVTHYSDPQVNQKVTELFESTDPQKQIELTQEAYTQASHSYGILIPMFQDAGYAASTKLHDVVYRQGGFDFSKAWLD